MSCSTAKRGMDNLTDIPHISSPLLYVFKGELIRIGRFIKEYLQYAKVFTGYGEIYGLYTHSRGAVVHVTALQNFNERQLRDAMSRRVEATRNEYYLSLIGGWLTVQDTNVSVRELLQKKASTLNESETYFCIVVDKLRSKFHSEDINGLTEAFFLVNGEIYKMDIKILERESPFRFDTDFTDMISSAGYTGDSVENEEFCVENFGTELKDLSPEKSETDIAPANSENLLEHNESELPELLSETRETECQDTSVEDSTEENSEVKKAQPVLPMKEASIEANTSENDGEPGTPDRGEEGNSTKDMDAWVVINSNDVDIPNVSPTDKIPGQATTSGNEKNNRVDHNADSLDYKQRESIFDNSVPEKNCTFENEDKIACVGAQPSEENDNDEDVRKEDHHVANEERSPDEDVSATTDPQDEERMIMETKGEVSVAEEQEGMNGSPEEISTREDTIENDIAPVAEQFQGIENDRDMKSGIFERVTVETEMINENKGNSMTRKDNDGEDKKSRERENGKNKDVKSDEFEVLEFVTRGKFTTADRINTDLEIELD